MCVCVYVCVVSRAGAVGSSRSGTVREDAKKKRRGRGENEVPKELQRKKSRQMNERVRICAKIESRKM